MARCKFRDVLWYSLLLINISFAVDASKLNVPRVLLPLFNQFSTNFTLEVSEDGCYKWTSSRPDIVQVSPLDADIDNGCSVKAVVSAITKEPTRNTIIVLAEEVRTGYVLRCDVIVDVIKSLSIVTTTRELFMEEAPEMFEVRAYDNQGNQFTTLEGVEFQWYIENFQTPAASQVLRFITFIDSPYEVPHSVAKFDSLGQRGSMVLIEGVKTGAAKVSVQLPHAEYSDVAKVEVVLTVVANLLLDPPDTHILVGDTVKFRLLQMQNGRLDEISLPSPQYVLDVEDSDVIVIDASVSVVRGLRLGQTRVVLRDRHRVLDGETGVVKLPTATVVVTEPAHLRLALQPHNNWAVLVDEPCTIQVLLYDRNNHKIHIGDSVYIRTEVSESYFRTTDMTRNGTVVDGVTVKVGTAPVTATLETVRTIGGTEVKFKPVITAQEDMLIYPRLQVVPDHVIVPWDPSVTKYEVELKASGGDGTYIWRSYDTSVATVSQSGIVRSHSLGETQVGVAMSRNPSIKAFSHIEVLPPSHLEILKHVLEAPVMKPITLHIVLYADRTDKNGNLERIPFTNCQQVPFKVELSHDNFYHNTTARAKPVGKACATVTVFGKIVGSTRVKISYRVKNVVLEAATDVAAYSPLEVVHPEKRVTVLALGTSRDIVWKGGPRVWLGRPAEHVRSISANTTTGIHIGEVTSASPSEFYVYSVVCKVIGEYSVELSVKNAAVDGNSKYRESVSTVKVVCANPRFISFSPETPVNESCPYSADSTRMVALNYEPIKIIVTITDALGRVFDNATSYNIDWYLSSSSLGYVQFDGMVVLEDVKEYNYLIPLYHYQIIHPRNQTGTLIVEATVKSYKMVMLSYFKITPDIPVFWVKSEVGESLSSVIKNSLTILWVDASLVTPARATVFNHPNNKVTLRVSHGSGFFNIHQSSTDIAEVQYHDGVKTIEIFPKSDGLLHLRIVDLCLSYDSPIVEIQVLKVGSMQVEMVDRVQQGSTITAVVWLYDTVDNALSVSDSDLLELRPHLDSQLVTITRLTDDNTDGLVRFNITGLELGSTSISFTSGYGEREIRSHPQPLQVFPPLRLFPHQLTLPVGALFQLTTVGGPKPDTAMEFTSSDSTIAKVNGAGLIEAQRVGDMTVTGSAIGYYKSTGSKVVYSKDTVNVHVIPLEGVKIHSPLVKLQVGCKMPLWAAGIPDKLTPLVLGSIQPPLVFRWSTSVPDTVQLQDVFHGTGLEVPEKDRLSMRVLGLKPGRVTVHLNVTMRTARHNVEFFDQLDLEIYEDLSLTKPDNYKASTLLMAPFSQMHLRTNKDSVSDITYSVVGLSEDSRSTQNTALTQSAPVVLVSKSGTVAAFGVLGSASVLIHSIEDNGLKQNLPVNIEVKPVHYVMLNVETKLSVGSGKVITALPRGLDLQFVLSYHDTAGQVFAATRTDIRTQQNRFDCVKVVRGEVNGTVVASLVDYCSSVLKVWDAGTIKVAQDYVKLRVDHLISPSKSEMTVGDVACFSMPLLDRSGEAGEWTSGAPEVLTMEAPTGVARAVRPGQALVRYKLKNSITTSTLIRVHPIQAIVFLSLNNRNLTNWGSFSVPLLLLSDHDSVEKSSNLVSPACPALASTKPQQLPFSCEIRFNSPMTPVDIHHVFNVQPSFDTHTGLYSCYFEALGAVSANTSVLSSNVTLRAISDSLVSEPLVIPFLPSVYLPTQELLLTDHQSWVLLSVIGVPQVLAHVQVCLHQCLNL
ncbi:nuclear pore membrane glycoprotein 210-like [Macrosteles quadrilineatus]|uniref:nuclear pore membrane glycoprotein 210-like n=1 Tax=Macrosteles quadrilineatus TaxID=74068 RepID=UPI0023E3344E|nr:nuclear pore membrane glycoprotein 210-like [Macrosteles quadrilineatus]